MSQVLTITPTDLISIFKRMLGHSKLLMSKPHLIPKVGWGYFQTLILGKPSLRTIEFAINTDCQSECVFCYATQNVHEDEEELSLEEIRRIWQEAKKLGAFSSIISGGEEGCSSPKYSSSFINLLRNAKAVSIFLSSSRFVCLPGSSCLLSVSRIGFKNSNYETRLSKNSARPYRN